ncbi:hypothetical protein GPJ56_006990 [Histomonas meleagridis]|uniref:uncharacterized protein n=1 Tax=Histomonas meleagridis TaxID=135588 RepID=UPI003559AC98|nr:hypothetical protein GPJ56_006990 [Histomonas meleagridis]KAH0796709.1 hypothetical protein GO595_010602 [Histomonas meleagridis]
MNFFSSINPSKIETKMKIHWATFFHWKKQKILGRDATFRNALTHIKTGEIEDIPKLIEQYTQYDISIDGAEMLEKYTKEVISNREIICKKDALPSELQTILNILYVSAPLHNNKDFKNDIYSIQKIHPSTANLAIPKEILILYKLRDPTPEEVIECLRRKIDRNVWTDQIINIVFGLNPKYSQLIYLLKE